MVKYETFNLCYMGSNPIGLKRFILRNYYKYIITLVINITYNYLIINGHRLMVDLSSSKRFVSIRIRLAVKKDKFPLVG